MMDRTEMFMAYPLSPDTVYCYGHVYDDTGKYDNGNPRDHLRELFGGFGGEVKNLLDRLGENPVVCGRLQSVTKPFFSKGWIVFVGDAGNACSPVLQQGAASAFEDVICLASQLSEHSADEAIDAYQRIRRPREEWVLRTSDFPIKNIEYTRSPIGAFMRNTLIRIKGPLNADGWRRLAKM